MKRSSAAVLHATISPSLHWRCCSQTPQEWLWSPSCNVCAYLGKCSFASAIRLVSLLAECRKAFLRFTSPPIICSAGLLWRSERHTFLRSLMSSFTPSSSFSKERTLSCASLAAAQSTFACQVCRAQHAQGYLLTYRAVIHSRLNLCV